MAGKKSGGGKGVNHRSSVTGRYTTAKKAVKSPKTHETEKRK